MEQSLVIIDRLSVLGEGREKIRGLSLVIQRSDNVVIFGPERSGLTTLSSILLGIDTEYEGNAYYKGRIIKDFDYIERHGHKRDIGYLHGDYGLMSNMNVEENISLPLEYHSELSSAEIGEIVDGLILDFGLNHCRTLRPIQLSGSEIFRTAYARSIIMDPDFLIIDHAFMDHAAIGLLPVFADLEKRRKDPHKATLFFTYHPKFFLDFADRFIMFYKGTVVFEGERETFLESDNPYLTQFLRASRWGPMDLD